jgi:photosynthetic reaction center cytochrome c subunit
MKGTENSDRSLLTGGLLPGVLSIILVLLTLTAGARPSGAPEQRQGTAQQAFKNIRVLKDIPADELIPSMEFVTASLGVECNYCHDRNAFEKDDKLTKQTARRMMEMLFAINAQNFQTKRGVTCYTCHQGSIKPVGIPMVQSTAPYVSEFELPADRAFPVEDNLPSASEILASYVAATGGEAAIDKVSTRVEKGSISFGAGPSFAVEVLSKVTDKQVMIVHLPQGDTSTIFDGERGWLSAPGSPVRAMHGPDLEGAKLDADLHFAIHLPKMFSDFKVVQRERIGDRDATLVFATNTGQPPLELYFDVNSGLLLRQLRFAKSELGLNPTQVDYADYTDFDGVKVPLHMTITRPNRRLDIHFVDVRQNSPISDSQFERETAAQDQPNGRKHSD